MEKRIDLKTELQKAKLAFSKLPPWKQHVLRNSMKGRVSVPREVVKQEPESPKPE